MPIYEYRCNKCGEFEVTQRITDKPLSKCPQCKAKVSKLISNTSFQLKGSGWYVTDYAGKGRAKDKAAESSGSESKAEGKSDAASGKSETAAKSETKPASKSDAKPSSSDTKGSSAAA